MNSHSCRRTIPGRRPDHGDTMAIRTSTTQNRDNANPPTAGECHYALLLAATAGCMTHDALSVFKGFIRFQKHHVPTFELNFEAIIMFKCHNTLITWLWASQHFGMAEQPRKTHTRAGINDYVITQTLFNWTFSRSCRAHSAIAAPAGRERERKCSNPMCIFYR